MKIRSEIRIDSMPANDRHHSWIVAARGQIEEVEARQASVSSGAVPTDAPLPAVALSGYELRCEIHRGGQGIVYQAIQQSTGRTVAIKMIREADFAGPVERSRFEREIKVLAALKHPNIVTIHDSGNAAGHLYFVMDFIAGQPLDLFVASENRPIADVLRLFAAICDAVNAAHLLGIVHRDIKPGNIRVAADGTPYVVDFGLARHTDGAPVGDDETELRVTPMTVTGQFVGSLPWATPEQADGRSTAVDQRTDVYSLGVVLFQILTGKFPYKVTGKMRRVLDNIAQAPPANPRIFCRAIDDEVATIILTCLNKDPDRRYQSAGDLASDIRKYLAGEPISAKRDSAWYVLRKSVRRHRWHVAIALAFVLTVTGSSIALSIMYRRQGSLLIDVRRERDKSVSAEELARQRMRQAEFESYAAHIAAADAAIAVGDGGGAYARLQNAPASLRNWEWYYLARQADQSIATWRGPGQLIAGQVALSDDGRFGGAALWMEKRRSAVQVWEYLSAPGSATPERASTPRMAIDDAVALAFPGDTRHLLVCRSSGELVTFDLASAREISRERLAPASAEAFSVMPSRDGRYGLIISSAAPQFWDIQSGQHLYDLNIPPGHAMIAKFDPSNRYLATGLSDGTLALWEAATGRQLAAVQTHSSKVVYGIAPSPNGRTLAIALGETGQIELWEVVYGEDSPTSRTAEHSQILKSTRKLSSGSQRVGTIAFSPDGHLLAAPSADKAVRLWNVADGTLCATLLGHATPAICADFSLDGRRLVSGGMHGEVKLWNVQTPPAVHVFSSFSGPVNSVAFFPDDSKLLLNGGSLCVADRMAGKCLQEFELSPTNDPRGAVPGPGASQVTFSNPDGSIRLWDIGSHGDVRVLGRHKTMPCLVTDSNARVLASADADAVVVWDFHTGRERKRFAGPGESVRRLAISPDGAQLALGLTDGTLLIREISSGRERTIHDAHDDAIQAIAFNCDGRSIATGSSDCTIKLRDVASGALLWSVSPQLGDVWCIAFSPDGSRLAVGGRDRSVRLIDARSGRELLALRGPTGTVMCVTFSPDGRSIAAGTWAHELLLWDSSPPPAG